MVLVLQHSFAYTHEKTKKKKKRKKKKNEKKKKTLSLSNKILPTRLKCTVSPSIVLFPRKATSLD